MSSPEKTTKTKTEKPSLPTPESTSLLTLPYDLLVSCISRVPAMYYPTLPLISKSFPSLPELRETRSLLSLTETCLFVCLRFPPDNKPRWFILSPKPNSTGYDFTPNLILNSPQYLFEKQVVVVDSTIYAIGGPINDVPSSRVSVLDCGSHKWREAPSMKMERFFATANVCDGKIYVAGGCESDDSDSSNWMEVYDPKTETWELVSNPLADKCGIRVKKSALVDGEIIMFGRKGVGYKPKEDKWEELGLSHYLDLGWKMLSPCVIDNVIYRFQRFEEIVCYDFEKRYWKRVKGLESLPKFDIYSMARLVDHNGKMVLLWEEILRSSGGDDDDDKEEKMIWCAVISLERREHNQLKEIWGNVEWIDGLLRVPVSCGLFCAVAGTI